MKIICKPKEEEAILASVEEEAPAEEVYKSTIERGECCVDHLCGCNCDC